MNNFLLEYKMKINGKSNEDMAKILNVDVSTFYRKKNGTSDFSRLEMQKIKSCLKLSAKEIDLIFFDEPLT